MDGTESEKMETEKMELGHEPQPGYGKAFAVVITAGSVYLAIILLFTL